ncbi:hypothetical protein C8R46DRAFT_1116123 [Mycena filopes]|nr:hypothetical protein C8R46DRAFT_1116123 [Mycena filopes]
MQIKFQYEYIPCRSCGAVVRHECGTTVPQGCKRCPQSPDTGLEAALLPTPPRSPSTPTPPAHTEALADPEATPDDRDNVGPGLDAAAEQLQEEIRALRLENVGAAAFTAIYLQIEDIEGAVSSTQPEVCTLVRRHTASLGRKMERLEAIFLQNTEKEGAAAFTATHLQIHEIKGAVLSAQPEVCKLVRSHTASLGRKMERLEGIFLHNT